MHEATYDDSVERPNIISNLSKEREEQLTTIAE
jgi:hypothetical protein